MVKRGMAKVAAGERTPDCSAEITVDAAFTPVIAGRHGHHALIASVPIVVDTFVSVAGREEDHTTLPAATVRRGVVDGQPGAGRQPKDALVLRIVQAEPRTVRRPPAARDDVG